MSLAARVEDASDSDPDEMDPADFDPLPSIISPANIPVSAPSVSQPRPPAQADIPRHFQCVYPVYFDQTRSRAEGRKVAKKLAVANPLARDILDAVQMLGLEVGFEADKLHPKDWANPGRVRVLLKREDGGLVNESVKNKHHLYIYIAQYLQAHPTTAQSPYRLRIRGVPVPDKPLPAPAAPRGWKMGTILPFHSPAYSGGGVTDNPFKEAMMEMQAQQGLPTASGGGEAKKNKKEKKKGRA
ncbi:signal recognition particle subunit [Ophidiomyces ophidiicola]|uniref:Signal recognition particle subunit n=1 Tax=Ophidiomyces ophidiicola TaxID=1387563 RepID=A0ACB8UPR8_9EURO|nr:signal recognition particle subunit [Ophidiomyces ophidiicola]KAI1912389.1 signal recognition particle subunit [Ophidiomyces ophidiicola]KAI1916478.1 signal recognition particle subunit [Ophidiomyces ophidiicola]KAI1928792.1 signal recognition particle subunit [Ophidiomyces ophidiicola]KAI1939254.1 signal recognition particle subunit [Ophidiomyces ophidiicola]KAI1942848.1 signal recognition particle subunit [Ophidiomyces ophidiicola]